MDSDPLQTFQPHSAHSQGQPRQHWDLRNLARAALGRGQLERLENKIKGQNNILKYPWTSLSLERLITDLIHQQQLRAAAAGPGPGSMEMWFPRCQRHH